MRNWIFVWFRAPNEWCHHWNQCNLTGSVEIKWAGAIKCVFLSPAATGPSQQCQLSLRLIYNWWRSQEITKKITEVTKSSKESNLFLSQAFVTSRSTGFLGSKWEIGTTALLGKETEGVFSGTTNQSHFGPLSVRHKFSSIRDWSWLHETQPWCISWLTSSAVCFWQTKSPSLQVDKKYIYQ